MLQSSLSKILSTISLSALSVGLLGGSLSSSCKAMDLDPRELKAIKLAGKSAEEINRKAARLIEKSEVETEKKDYILARVEALSTLAESVRQPGDAEGLRASMVLSAAQAYYDQKSLEEEVFGKSLTFKLEKASFQEISSEIKRLAATIRSLPEAQQECVSPQIGALKAYLSLQRDGAPQELLDETVAGYYAATAAWKAIGGSEVGDKKLEKSTVIVKENEKTASTASVAPKAPQRIGLKTYFLNLSMDDEYVDEANRVWRLIGGDKLGSNIQGQFPSSKLATMEQWYFEPAQDNAQLIKKDNPSFENLLKLNLDVSVLDQYGVRFNLNNPTTKERKDQCYFFMVLKNNNNQ